MERILLIEDDPNAISLYKEILTTAGYSVDVAKDGKAGLIKILEGGYSLIFLDIMLPELDGLSVLAAARKQTPKKMNGKIIILSNLTQDPVIKEAMELGAFDHIAKPSLSPEEFVVRVKALLKVV